MTHFNALSPAEAERLAFLLEELGETQQAIGKILRHGYESFDPFLPPPAGETNRGNLIRELGDVLVAIDLLLESGDISEMGLLERKAIKRHRISQWLHHNPLST